MTFSSFITTHKTLLWIATVALAAWLVAFTADAAVYRMGEEYTLGLEETVPENLYVAASTVLIHGNAAQDVVAAGGTVLVTGSTTKDVMIAGGTVNILGPVGDDVRAAGGDVRVGSKITGDAMLFGGQVQLLTDGSVGNDLHMAGGHIVVDGMVEGDVLLSGGDIEINGTIDGDVKIRAGESIVIGDRAIIRGNVDYESHKEAFISEDARVAGAVTYTERDDYKQYEGVVGAMVALAGVFLLFKFLTLLAASILFVVLFPAFSRRVVTFATNHGAAGVGIGFATWALAPILAIILLFTIIGFLTGIGLLAGYIALLLLAKILSGIMAGSLLSGWLKGKPEVDWKWTLLGVFSLQLIRFIPILGWLVNLLIMFAVIGSLVRGMYDHWWVKRKMHVHADGEPLENAPVAVGEPHADPPSSDVYNKPVVEDRNDSEAGTDESTKKD